MTWLRKEGAILDVVVFTERPQGSTWVCCAADRADRRRYLCNGGEEERYKNKSCDLRSLDQKTPWSDEIGSEILMTEHLLAICSTNSASHPATIVTKKICGRPETRRNVPTT